MNRLPAPAFLLLLLLTVSFTLATGLEPRTLAWNKHRAEGDSLVAVSLGDAQRMFATYFFREADVYFHSDYYPSIFDQAHTNEADIAEEVHATPGAQADEASEDFLGKSRDWVEHFGRHFYVTKHTHLSNANVHEILPWLRISADLDPHQTQTYVVTAYFLWQHMNRPQDAEAFLREGLRNNPDSYELLFELGKMEFEYNQDHARARNLWELAWRDYSTQHANGQDADLSDERKILGSLMRVEKADGHYAKAADYLQTLYEAIPTEETGPRKDIKDQIDELRQDAAAPPAR